MRRRVSFPEACYAARAGKAAVVGPWALRGPLSQVGQGQKSADSRCPGKLSLQQARLPSSVGMSAVSCVLQMARAYLIWPRLG